jgi:O-antigen ligase
MSRFQPKLANPLLPIHAGILATFALIPVWKRFSTLEPPPLLLPNLYVSYFWILLPMLWSIGWWMILRLPGFAALRRDTLRAGWVLALLLLALWVLASPLWAFQRHAHPEVAASTSLQFGVAALFAIVVACAAPPRRTIAAVLVIGLLWTSLITLGQVIRQGSIGLSTLGEFTLGVNQPGIGYVQVGDARWLRPYGLLPHPNMLAGYFAIGLLPTLVWILSGRRLLRWAGILIYILGLWSFLLTFSRAAWIGFAAGIFAIFPILIHLYRKSIPKLSFSSSIFTPHFSVSSASLWFKFLPRLLLIFVIAGIVGLSFAITFHPFLAARAGVGGESIELRSVSDRLVFAKFAYDSILERPIIGVGMGNFPWRASYYIMYTDYDLRGDNVHHTLLSAWAELGLVGVVLLVATLVLGVETALRDFRREATGMGELTGRPIMVENTLIRLALLGGFISLTAIGLLDHYPWTILQFQVAWWSLLAAVINPPDSALSRLPVSPRMQSP